jgi:hypothetical protein
MTNHPRPHRWKQLAAISRVEEFHTPQRLFMVIMGITQFGARVCRVRLQAALFIAGMSYAIIR